MKTFEKGQSVRLSETAKEANIRGKSKHKDRGTVIRVSRGGWPVVVWDGQVTACRYHPDFITRMRHHQ